jgi:hypothetical protein
VSNFQTHFRSSKADEHINKIGDEIISQIRRSKFLIADFTGHRGGVYFEAGLAMGLGLPVFWTCRRDDLDKLHFDIRSEVQRPLSVIRDRVEPAASPAMSVIAPKAEVNSGRWRYSTETALAHVIGDKAEQAHRRSDALDKRRNLMEAWTAYCEPKGSNNVVQIRKRKTI